MQVLPLVPSIPLYTFDTLLDGVAYVFRVYWNARDEAWYMDIADGERVVVAYGLKIVLGTSIGRTVDHELTARGSLIAIDRSGENRDATFDDIGQRVLVLYVPALELVGALAEGLAL